MQEALQLHQEYIFDFQMESMEPMEHPVIPIMPKASKVGSSQNQYFFNISPVPEQYDE
jgi:hypothetical protein